MRARRSGCCAAWIVLTAAWSFGAASEERVSPEDREFFETKIRPLLTEKCYGCHSTGAKRVKAGLLLDSKAGRAKGGDSGAAVVPGKLVESLLWIAVSYEDPDLQMPPKKRLEPAELAALREWIARGAPDPRAGTPAPEPRQADEFDIAKLRDGHWAWQAAQRTRPPAVKDSGWPADPIDRFVLARLEAAGLTPAPPARKTAWLRRVTFALTGLPPTREEIEAFLQDTSPEAFADVVADLARERGLSSDVLQRWVDRLSHAREDPGDPLYAFAVLAVEPGEPEPRTVTRLKREILQTWRARAEESEKRRREQKIVVTVEQGERNYVKTERVATEDDGVVDYGRSGSEDWIAVGYRFGSGPTAPGEVVLGESAARPIERVVEDGAATADLYSNLRKNHANNARATDQPTAGLLKDLKRRGLLDETLVFWAGEFGRTPFAQGSDGRDHNPYGFTVWLAGGGVKGGITYGETDEYGYRVVERRVEMYDLHATILHLLGLDHKKLTYRFGGRDMRLTDVHGEVVHALVA